MTIFTRIREKLAELEHEQWGYWIRYQILKGVVSLSSDWARWQQQAITLDEHLTEKEKESDRKWADKVIQIIEDFEVNRKNILRRYFDMLRESKIKNEVANPVWQQGFDSCLNIISEVVLNDEKFEELIGLDEQKV